MKLYLDESGNSGDNLNDKIQPLYIVGGYIFEAEEQPDITQKILDWEMTRLQKGQSEIKSNKFLKRDGGFAELCALLKSCTSIGGMPAHVICEKKFMIAAKIADTFLDPAYNSMLNMNYHVDAVEKNKIGNIIYDTLPEVNLTKFWDVRKLTLREFELEFSEIVRLISVNDNELAIKIKSADLEKSFQHLNSEHAHHNPNVPCFYNLLSQLQVHFDRLNINKWSIVHDQTSTFEPVLTEIKNMFVNSEVSSIPLSNGMEMRFGSLNLKDLTFAESKNDPMVRLCDYYVGCLNHIIKKVLINDHEYLKSNSEDLMYLFAQLVLPMPELSALFHMLTSDWLGKEIGHKVLNSIR